VTPVDTEGVLNQSSDRPTPDGPITIIVQAAGDGARWKSSTPKHLTVVNGERLIDRVVRQFRDNDRNTVLINGPYLIEGADKIAGGRDGIDSHLAVAPHWSRDGRTLVVLGDTWYTDAAARTILAPQPEWTMYARFTPSRVTGKPYPEPFAHSFWPAHHAMYADALRQVVALHEAGTLPRAGLWEVYKLMFGKLLPWDWRQYPVGHHVVIDDCTEDFDFIPDLVQWRVGCSSQPR
jgi:hypothetical protein